MSRRAWLGNLAGVGVVVALVVALVLAQRPASDTAQDDAAQNTAPSTAAPTDSAPSADLAGPRAEAGLQSCPRGTGAPGGPLAGLTLDCLGDGSPVELGAALAGTPAVLDVWAWDCPPCADELPALAEFSERAGPAVRVLTVHSDPATPNALERLATYGVRLPGVADPTSRVAALVGAPQVLPVTILLRADGSVAKILAKPYTTPDEIGADVERYLGVTA